MKILILGGDGFIGSHLRDAHLERSDEVTIIDKENIRSKDKDGYEFYKIDACNIPHVEFVLNKTKPDLVYNCIAVANPGFYVKYPQQTFDIDFSLNQELLSLLQTRYIPYIHFSTSEVYGKLWTGVMNEESTDLCIGPVQKHRWIYATSKILLEQLIISLDDPKHKAVIVRPFNFIGHDIDWIPAYHGQKEWIPRVYSCFMNSLFKGEKLQIVKPGSQKRCYTHIDDAISALLSIVDNFDACAGKVLNIGVPENEISIEDLAVTMVLSWADIVCRDPIPLNDVKDEIIKTHCELIGGEDLYGEGYEDSQRRVPDISAIQTLTGWEPSINIHDAIYNSMIETVKIFDLKNREHI